jgi:hypothetical protein
VIGEYVRLDKKGRTWWGRCPFHSEKTGSFAVHEAYFYCHGCGAKGDVIDFTALIERVSKGRAIRLLAERVGIDVGAEPTRRESAWRREVEAQAGFWWTERRRAAVEALRVACAALTVDPGDAAAIMAESAGARIQVMDGISAELRMRVFLRSRTAADRRAWEWHSAWDREFEAAWLGLAGAQEAQTA